MACLEMPARVALYIPIFIQQQQYGDPVFYPPISQILNLKWEQDKSKNIGLDLHMFNNRVELIADAYIKQISNLILPATGPMYLGGYLSGGYGGQLSWPLVNYGSMENRGIGAYIKHCKYFNKKFSMENRV